MQSYNASTGSGGHYFNGCYTSTAATNTSTSTSSNTNNSQVCSKTGIELANPVHLQRLSAIQHHHQRQFDHGDRLHLQL